MIPLPTTDNANENLCGDCTECCVAMPIQWEDGTIKPRHTACHHLGDAGCRIHAAKPSVCREFLCVWRVAKKRLSEGKLETEPGFEIEDYRPDRAGAIIHETEGLLGDLNAFMVTETRPGALKQLPNTLKLVASLSVQAQVPVAINEYDGTRKILVAEGPGMIDVSNRVGERLAKFVPQHADTIKEKFQKINEGSIGERLTFEINIPGMGDGA